MSTDNNPNTSEYYRKVFPKRLEYYMWKTGKKQVDLTTDLGFSSSTVSNWCNGIKLPRMGTIQILANYFGIRKSDLIEEPSSNEPEPPAPAPQLTKEETELLSLLRAVPAEEQEKVLMAVEVALRSKGLL